MAKPELGTKRICPETGRKFYDLNKDPIVSPYTGHTYPRSYFESGSELVDEEEDLEDKELSEEGPEILPLDEADEDASKTDDTDIPDLDDDEDVDLGDDDDDTFLEEEEDDDDVTGIIGVGDDDDDEH